MHCLRRSASPVLLHLARVAGIILFTAIVIVAGFLPSSVHTVAASSEALQPFSVRSFTDRDGNEIVEAVIAGMRTKVLTTNVEEPVPSTAEGLNVLPDVPAFDWSYGCSATSAAILFGYYDRTGYNNMYAGPANGEVCPLDNSIWGAGVGGSVAECPLSATHMGKDGRTTRGTVDDYWVKFGNKDPDPYIANGWTEHTSEDCVGDFMGTSQSRFNNSDGATTFYALSSGDPLYDYTGSESIPRRDGCHGMRLFAESRGYTVTTNFSQRIEGYTGTTPGKGFTFADYVAEIDAGHPVLIQLEGHTVLGYGYGTEGNVVYIRDTWDHNSHTMTWGGTYSGMQQWAVTVIRLASLGSAPTASTGSATNITSSSGTLNSNLSSMGTAASVAVSFEWGTASGVYSNSTVSQSLSATGAFTCNLSGLSPSTTYYYRAKAAGNGTAYGSEKSFTTSAPPTTPPTVVTNSATNITSSSGTLNGNLSSLGTAASVAVSFEWGTASGVYSNSTTSQSLSTTGAFTYNLSGLSPSTTYYYRAKAAGNGTAYGSEKSFTTPAPPTTPPTVVTNNATNIASSSGTLNGNLSSLGTAASVAVSFEWGTAPGVYSNSTTSQSLSATGAFTCNLSGLSPSTTYYYRAKAAGDGTAYGSEKSFTTSAPATTPPTVVTNSATNITSSSGTLNGNLSSLGTAASVAVSFEWGTASGVYSNSTASQFLSTTGAFTCNLSGLSPSTTYYYRAKAAGNGTAYGSEKSFTTSAPPTTPPTVATNSATNITSSSGTLNGNLSSLGTAASVAVSFEWGTASGVYSNSTTTQSLSATGAFTYDLSGLSPSTTYYYRAKAAGNGTAYGSEKSFTTPALPITPAVIPPQITIKKIVASGRTGSSVILTADLTSLGTADSVMVSFVWGTVAGGPYTNETQAQLCTATGTYSAKINGLTAGTTYYFRAKAVGDETAYSEEAGTRTSKKAQWPWRTAAISGAGVLSMLGFMLFRKLAA